MGYSRYTCAFNLPSKFLLHGGGLADMLVVAATVGVLHGVHRHTAHLVSGVRGPQGQGGEVVTVA